jgi:cytochrome oxidase Cu insertion factor (SCO1/SenC/PrrC family)
MDFVPPAPGTYVLQRIQAAADGEVLDAAGKRRRLAQFTRGSVTLLSFMYANCSDAGGCPYAFVVLHEVKRAIESLPAAHGRVRIISLSFDPERDTPQMMALYGGDHAREYRGVRWDFLTTASARQLLPIVDGFGQDVAQGVDAATGRPTGRFAHVLKVFLVDAKGIVREIYAAEYLLPEVVINDVKTLLMEQGVRLQ